MHCHILPGVDDGAKDLEETKKMLNIAYKDGVRYIIATPHYHPKRGQSSQVEIKRQLNLVRQEAKKIDENFLIFYGNEIYFGQDIPELLQEKKILAMNGRDYVLVEFSPSAEAAYIKVEKAFNEMSLEEAISALNDGTLGMEYSAVYSYNGLTKQRGAIFYNGHRETYYSEKVLPGNGLNIPGRHVADDGTIRDADGYICVAADPSYMAKGSVLITSLGPAKVYDSGCAYGTIDIYVNW